MIQVHFIMLDLYILLFLCVWFRFAQQQNDAEKEKKKKTERGFCFIFPIKKKESRIK